MLFGYDKFMKAIVINGRYMYHYWNGVFT